ncbi:MAG: CxxxxCH/CxxCH domain c-type cytochrome, partial [Desulfuromonadaceae bacterium]
MGKIIKKNINGMSWLARTGLVLLLTMTTIVLCNPSDAAAVTYYMTRDTATSLSADGTCNITGLTPYTVATMPGKTTTLTSEFGTASRFYPTTTAGASVVMLKVYTPVYSANSVDISNITASVAFRGNAATDTIKLDLYDYDPAGAANNGTLVASSTAKIVTGGTTLTAYTWTAANFTVSGTGRIAQGHRLQFRLTQYSATATSTSRLYFGIAGTTASTSFTVTETPVITDSTPPTAGTVTITPDISSTYTSAAPTITAAFTDAQSAVTSCEYTTNGTAWVAGVVSGAASPYTCAASPTALTGFLNINMRATSAGGTTTATQIQRTVDTSVPTDGTLTITAGNLQNAISWTAATDPGGSGIASYVLRYATGATAPANCTSGTAVPGSPFTSATLATTHTGLINSTQYSYRLCATDNLGNTSGGVTKSATPVAGPPTTITLCGGCHGHPAGPNVLVDANRAASAGTFQGSHTEHAPLITDCVKCHTNPARLDHSDGVININAAISGGTYTGGTTVAISTVSPRTFTTTCNTTTCHGGVSPVWGSATAQATCTKCHGVLNTTPVAYTADTKTAAPGYSGTGRDTGGATVAIDAQVGAHDTHLRASNNISSAIACAECHSAVNATNSTFTGHMDGNATVNFGTLATSGTGTAPGYSAGTCSNTYCHYGRTTYAAPATANGAVVWNNTAYLNGGTPSLTGDCGKCHASPPLTTGSHVGVTNINQCNGCHNHVTATGTFSDPTKHINGVVDASGCSTCHGWPPTTNAHTIHINNIIAEKGLGSLPGGFLNNPVCGTCHNVSALTKHAGDATSDGTSRNIYLPTPSLLQASYQFGASAVSYDTATTKCSNLSCHFIISKAWGTPPTAACQACHGYPPVTAATDVDNKHVAGATAVNHIGSGATVNTKATFVSVHGGCQICHGTESLVADGSGAQSPHANYVVATQHATGNINMNGPVGTGTGYDSTIR